jgi:hypothetical protein
LARKGKEIGVEGIKREEKQGFNNGVLHQIPRVESPEAVARFA